MTHFELQQAIAHRHPVQISMLNIAWEKQSIAQIHKQIAAIARKPSPWGINTAIDEGFITVSQAISIMNDAKDIPFDIYKTLKM